MNKSSKAKKASSIIWAFIYAILVCAVCVSGCFLFHSYYYRSIFVSGASMHPTLMGGQGTDNGISYFGIIDPTDRALRKIKRFDIITTYYPWADYETIDDKEVPLETADYKIKRVIALPGESIKIANKSGSTDFEFHIKTVTKKGNEEFTTITHYGSDPEKICEEDGTHYIKVPFKRIIFTPGTMARKNTIAPNTDGWITMAEDEYWVMGDNCPESADSATVTSSKNNGPVRYKDLVGVLVAIEGTCTLVTNKYDSTGKRIPDTCINRKYFWPKVM